MSNAMALICGVKKIDESDMKMATNLDRPGSDTADKIQLSKNFDELTGVARFLDDGIRNERTMENGGHHLANRIPG